MKGPRITLCLLLGTLACVLMAAIMLLFAADEVNNGIIVAATILSGAPLMWLAGYRDPADWRKAPLVPTLVFATILAFAIGQTHGFVDGFQGMWFIIASPLAQIMYAVCMVCWIVAYAAKRRRQRINNWHD